MRELEKKLLNDFIINIMENFKVGDYVKLQKISDDKFNGRHPNDINKRHTIFGRISRDFGIGSSLFLAEVTGDSFGFFYTSGITEIIDENTFQTENSTYYIEHAERKSDLLAKIAELDYEELDNMSKT